MSGRTGVSVPVVFLLDLRALLLGVEILVGDLFELDHFGGCVWVIGVLREWWRLMCSLVVDGMDVGVVSQHVRLADCS
jgi:hypothetical protein